MAGPALASGNDGTMSPQNLAAYPTCVEYRGDDGWVAHIQGAAVDAHGTPAVGAHLVLHASDGRVFRAVTDDAGYIVLDVPVRAHHEVMRIGRADPVTCIRPRATVG